MTKQIKYSYCVDENGELVHIKSITDETRHARKLFCLQCGQEMVPNLGKIKTWYFSHKADTACDGESYLHKLAKKRIKETFDSSSHFPITFFRDVPCREGSHCPCMDKSYCISIHVPVKSDLKLWNEKVIYDICQEEEPYGDFRPDLLLTHSSKPEREPVFIEIYKSHKSDDNKLRSKYKIIETHKLESESDIEEIVKCGFVEGNNCEFYNFTPKLPSKKSKKIPIERFVLFKSGAAIVHRAIDYEIYCDKINQRVDSRSVIELNIRNWDVLGMAIKLKRIGVGGMQEVIYNINSYQAGLIYLVKKGYNIRNCILCKYYKFNDYYAKYFCTLYKVNGLNIPCPAQSVAKECQRYELNQQLMNYPIEELEKDISEVPM